MNLEFILHKEKNFVSVGKFRYVFFFNSNIDVVSFPETNFLTPNSETEESSLKQGVPLQNRGTWQT